MSDSSWYYRFTRVSCGLEHLAQDPCRTLDKRLSPFEDVLIQDNTIIRLHEKLAKTWPATRSRKAAAGAKLGVLVSAIVNGPKSVALYAENTNDLKILKDWLVGKGPHTTSGECICKTSYTAKMKTSTIFTSP